ncbi:MAG: adenylate/guanylate cyclase domain-containing protein [Mesorhizobium sp.]|nr:MAG: adenylate/guanylate cyclase domain-containing protein [Mesorhizobium sp.]
MHRKLAAIVSVDVVGYSRLMERDEAGAHARVMAMIEGVLGGEVTAHSGKIVKLTGDGALVTFDSVVDAIECAVAVQQRLAAEPDDERLQLRIGVTLGDVILDQGDVYGQGVNVAARLQAAARPGSIYVSRAAVEQAQGKAAATFDLVGNLTLRNMDEPVEVFRALPGRPDDRPRSPWFHRMRWLPRAAIVGPAVAAAVVAAWVYMYRETDKGQLPKLGAMAPPLPQEDSIAVIPFVDLSSNSESKPFVDGIFDDLLTDLSKLRSLNVLAKNSVDVYKAQKTPPATIAADLSVRYILEGSVRRADNNLRINVRLVDSRGQQNVWAQSYTGPVEAMFDVQDNMVEDIVNSLAVKVSEQERVRILSRETTSVDAYDAFRKGQAALLEKTPESLPAALVEFRKAVAIDPDYSQAHAGIGQVFWNAWVWGWESYVGETWETAPGKTKEHLKKALERPTASAYQLASDVDIYARNFDDSLEFARLAVDFAPNDPSSHVVMAEALIYGGSPAEAIPWLDAADNLDRNAAKEPPPYNVWVRGMAYFGQQKFEEAIALFDDALQRNPEDFGPAAPLAAAHWHLAERLKQDSASAALAKEHEAKAEAALKQYYEGWPEANIQDVIIYWPFRQKAVENLLVEPLRALGMPETEPG